MAPGAALGVQSWGSPWRVGLVPTEHQHLHSVSEVTEQGTGGAHSSGKRALRQAPLKAPSKGRALQQEGSEIGRQLTN